MPMIIESIYEEGVFKPLDKIDIKEHTKVKIALTIDPAHPATKENGLDGIIDIAKDCFDADLSTQHDKLLYGDVLK